MRVYRETCGTFYPVVRMCVRVLVRVSGGQDTFSACWFAWPAGFFGPCKRVVASSARTNLLFRLLLYIQNHLFTNPFVVFCYIICYELYVYYTCRILFMNAFCFCYVCVFFWPRILYVLPVRLAFIFHVWVLS